MAARTQGRMRRQRTEMGSAPIEFGLAAPFLLMMLLGVVELGFAMYQAMQIYDSVEAGALYAAQFGFNSSGISHAVVNATGTEGITASPPPEKFCGCPASGGIVPTSCNATCNDGKPAGQYVRISAQILREQILPYPPLPLPDTLTAQSIVRLK